jgi:hypothetical protein
MFINFFKLFYFRKKRIIQFLNYRIRAMAVPTATTTATVEMQIVEVFVLFARCARMS